MRRRRRRRKEWCRPGVAILGWQVFLEQSWPGEASVVDSAGNWVSVGFCFLWIIGSEKSSSVTLPLILISLSWVDELLV